MAARKVRNMKMANGGKVFGDHGLKIGTHHAEMIEIAKDLETRTSNLTDDLGGDIDIVQVIPRMIHECIQRLEQESNVIRSYARELRQRADHTFELEIVRYFLEALGDAAIRV